MNMKTKKLRIAVVGGNIGRAQLLGFSALPECYQVQAVCDVDERLAKSLAVEFSAQAFEADYDALCRRDDIDVISLCTPPNLHRGQIEQALRAGFKVICEKPLVGSLRHIDELSVIEKQTGGSVMPIFQLRYGHGLQKLKHLSAAGLTGKAFLSTVETAWRRDADYYANPWRGSLRASLGGCLLQQSIHCHDMLTYILGPVREVFARTDTRVNPIETEDCAALSMRMCDDSLVTSAVTLGSMEQITRHRFCFEGLTAESNTSAYENSGDPWRFIGAGAGEQARIDRALADFRPEPEGYAGQFIRYYQSLTEGKVLPVTLADARASIELVTACYASALSGESVAMPLPQNHALRGGWIDALERRQAC
jgi:predicted dehydrogenase